MDPFLLLLFLAFNNQMLVLASPKSPYWLLHEPSMTSHFNPSKPTLDPFNELKRRQTTTDSSTCGFKDGDKNQPRTANSGYDCRVDTKNGLWGFCPTTVISAS